MYLADIMDTGELERLVNERYITRRADESGRFVLHNYTEKATFDRVWTAETRQCRGIISTVDGEIVARPFDKFHNVDETEETRLDALLCRSGTIEITDKLDGSMIALWHAQGAWHTSTRGSFTSTQAIAAKAWLQSRIDGWNSSLQQFTFLCEWCAPDNRVVLKYDNAQCVLIGARRLATGLDLDYTPLQIVGDLASLPVTPRQTGTLEDIVAQRPSTTGCEGWVARWPDGFRVKIKTEDYLRLHRLVSGFGASRVRDVLLAGGWNSYLPDLPEEFRNEAERMAQVMRDCVASRMTALMNSFDRLAPLAKESRKTYALAVLQEPVLDRPYLFSLIDGKSINDKVLANIDLSDIGLAEKVETCQ